MCKREKIENTNMHVETAVFELTMLLTQCTTPTPKVNTTIIAWSFLEVVFSPQSRSIRTSIKANAGREGSNQKKD